MATVLIMAITGEAMGAIPTVVATMGGALFVAILLPIFSVILLYAGAQAFFKKRLIEDVPTSKVQGVTMGLNEIKGTATTDRPLRAYLSEKSVVYYNYTVEEQWKKKTRRDGKTETKTGWKTIKSGTRFRNFYVRDETGSIRINPKGAEFHGDKVISKTCRKMDPLYYGKGPRKSIRNSTGKRRFREEIIPNGESAYVMGDARVRDDIAVPEIAEDEFGKLFLISSQGEDKLVSKFTWKTRGCFLGALLMSVATPFIFRMAANDGLSAEEVVPLMNGTTIGLAVGAGVMVFMVILGLYFKTVFNGLVDLRNRAKRAWSMLEVEFKRRHDLIPGLVNIVQAVADHERATLEAVAQARSGSGGVAKNPGGEETQKASSAIDQQSSALGNIFAVAEKYPNLKADKSYRKLMEELTRCEDKIALARGFYNDTVENVNNRVHTFPDMLLAGLAGTEEEEYLEFQEFEKKPIQIDLTPDEDDDEEYGEDFEETDGVEPEVAEVASP